MSCRTRAVAVAVNACRPTPGQVLAQHCELPVLGAEIVAPLADAVRFVDGDEARRPAAEQRHEPVPPLAYQPLGRDVQEPIPPVAQARHHARPRVRPQRAVVAGRGDAVADERVDLILHQRDQRRDDDRQPLANERRRLEADRFPAAGRQHDERVAPVENRLHRLLLERPERRVAPDPFEHREEHASSLRAGRGSSHGSTADRRRVPSRGRRARRPPRAQGDRTLRCARARSRLS